MSDKRVFLYTFWMAMILLYCGCGEDRPCELYKASTVTDEEAYVLETLADTFVEAGHAFPCCRIQMCRGENSFCSGLLSVDCGITHIKGDECREIWIDGTDKPGCRDLARTATEEWLHAEGYRETEAMRAEKARILDLYRGVS